MANAAVQFTAADSFPANRFEWLYEWIRRPSAGVPEGTRSQAEQSRRPPFRLVEADARLHAQVHGAPPACA
jgi:hypothetical protein